MRKEMTLFVVVNAGVRNYKQPTREFLPPSWGSVHSNWDLQWAMVGVEKDVPFSRTHFKNKKFQTVPDKLMDFACYGSKHVLANKCIPQIQWSSFQWLLIENCRNGCFYGVCNVHCKSSMMCE